MSQPSLVDAVVKVIERWPFFLVPFVLIVLLFGWFAWQQDPPYEFVSVYQPARLSVGTPLQSADSLAVTVEAVVIPELYEDFEPENHQGKRLVKDLLVDSPSKGEFILVSSEATKKLKPEVQALHEAVFALLKSQQEERIAVYRASVETKLESVRMGMEIIDPNEFSEAYSEALKMEASLEASLREIQGGKTLILGRAKEKLGAITPPRLVLIGGVVAFFVSVIIVFFIEFCGRVYARLSNNSSRPGA